MKNGARAWLERRLQALAGNLLLVEKEERPAVAWSAAYFFLLLAGYYIIRPLRETMGLLGGVDNLHWLFLGTLAGTLVLSPVFSYLVGRMSRRRFIPIVYRFFLINMLGFFVAMAVLPEERLIAVARVFYVWVSVYNMFVVSIFWSLMADLFRREQGKRLFAVIASGGTIGAIFGSWITAQFAESLGTRHLLLISAVFLELTVWCVHGLLRRAPAVVAPAAGGDGSGWRGALEGMKLVLSSRYLLGIALFMFLFTLLSTFAYFEQANIVAAAVTENAARARLFAAMNFWVNTLTLLAQWFLAGRFLRRFGLSVSLSTLPVIALAGFASLAAAPVLWVLVPFQVVRRAANFALVRPAREALYTVVNRSAKYKAKNFIDTFVYRGGDAVGAAAFRQLVRLEIGLSGIALTALPLALLWLWNGFRLGSQRLDPHVRADEAPDPTH